MKNQKTAGHERLTTDVRQTQIVDAAMRILATKGSRRLTAELLGAEVGITGGAIFRHFKSMDAIIDAVVDRTETILFEGFPPEAADPIERLGEFFQNRVRAITSNPNVSKLLLSDLLAHAGSRTHTRRIESFKRRSRSFIFQCICEARDSGILNKKVEPEEGTILVAGSMLALAHAKIRVQKSKKAGELAHNVWKTIETFLRRENQAAARTQNPLQVVRQPLSSPTGKLKSGA